MRTLHLTLKKKWFDMIASGEKKEEYREIKPYWEKRFHDPFDTHCAPDRSLKQFDRIVFRNGYSSNAPSVTVKCLEVGTGLGNPDWGAVPNQLYFVIKLGEVIQ